jgi:two-component system response regulator HydG
VSINCAAIPDSLLESELFGCERGAFTGADSARAGHLTAAAGGTVLLDEIGEMTSYAQAKILRALDTREVYRLGSTQRPGSTFASPPRPTRIWSGESRTADSGATSITA